MNKAGIKSVFNKNIPTVGELRGKAWIFKGLGVNFAGFTDTYRMDGAEGVTDNSQIYLQNMYNVNTTTLN